MNNSKKYQTLLILLICSMVLCYSQSTHLPYSIFGIGELAAGGFSRNLAMGKTGFAISSDQGLNNLNPASYYSIDSISFFFDVGFSGDFINYRSQSTSQRGNDVRLHNLAIGFPITTWWKSSLGIVPFSTVAYKVVIDKNVEVSVDNEGNLITLVPS